MLFINTALRRTIFSITAKPLGQKCPILHSPVYFYKLLKRTTVCPFHHPPPPHSPWMVKKCGRQSDIWGRDVPQSSSFFPISSCCEG